MASFPEELLVGEGAHVGCGGVRHCGRVLFILQPVELLVLHGLVNLSDEGAVLAADDALLSINHNSKAYGQQGDDEYADGLETDIVGTSLLPLGLHLLLW